MDYTLLLRFAVILIVSNAGSTLAGLQTRDGIHAGTQKTEGSMDCKCQEIQSRVPDCGECYTCNDEAIIRHRSNNQKIYNLTLSEGACNSTASIRVCCVSQDTLMFRKTDNLTDSECGIYNFDAYPRKQPPTNLVVLEEFRWRAWIYNSREPSMPLCASTLISKGIRAVLTSAACVEGLLPSDLMVRFDKRPQNYNPINVTHVVVHDGFDSGKRTNDIAMLGLQSVPASALAVCLPTQPASFETNCAGFSREDYFISETLSKPVECVDQNEDLEPSSLCARTGKYNFNPEAGSGMICMDEDLDIYLLYGIHQYTGRNGSAAFNTNVTHFAKWINASLQKLKTDLL